MQVCLLYHDMDRHEAGCDCSLCNSNGKSYGVAIVQMPEGNDFETEDEIVDFLHEQDPIEVVYAPSEDAAYENAKQVCVQQGYEVV